MKNYLSSSLTFVKSNETQAELLVDFEKTIAVPRLYSSPLDLAGAIKEIQNNNYYFIKYNEIIVATAAYFIREDRSCHISNIAVGENHRGKGIGKKAMAFLLDKCKNHWRIDLVTHPENFRAMPLYQSFGFVIESRIENFYGDGEPRLMMVRNNVLTKKF